MQLPAPRKHYLCAKCKNELKAPVSDSAPLRVLHLYITVAATDGLPTPLRMKPIPVVLEAPPDSWAWNKVKLDFDLDSASKAVPMKLQIGKDKQIALFNSEASKTIWCSAGAFRGEAPEVASSNASL